METEVEISPDEIQRLLAYDSCSFGFLKLDKPEEVGTKQLLQKGVKYYESIIKSAVRVAKEENRKPHVDAGIFCRLGHVLLLLDNFEKALSAYQKYHQLQEDHWKNSPFLYGLGFVYFHFNAYQLWQGTWKLAVVNHVAILPNAEAVVATCFGTAVNKYPSPLPLDRTTNNDDKALGSSELKALADDILTLYQTSPGF